MKSTTAQKLISDIDVIIVDIQSFSSASPSEKAYFAGFLIVLICGKYEEIIERIISERADKLKDQSISNYVARSLNRIFRNPDLSNVLNLLKLLDTKLANEIKKMPDSSRDALTSIINNKNYLAHGTASINATLNDVIIFYHDSKTIIEKIDDMLL